MFTEQLFRYAGHSIIRDPETQVLGLRDGYGFECRLKANPGEPIHATLECLGPGVYAHVEVTRPGNRKGLVYVRWQHIQFMVEKLRLDVRLTWAPSFRDAADALKALINVETNT